MSEYSEPKSIIFEFVGTFSLVTFAASTAIGSYLISWMNPYIEHIFIAVTVSVVVGLSIVIFGKISGAHLNPSISLAHTLDGLMPKKILPLYLGAQLLAAVFSGVVLHILFQSFHSPTIFGSTKFQDGATPISGGILEILGAFILSCAALKASTSLKGQPKRQAMLNSIVLFILTVVIGPFTGASFNPARSLGPAIASGIFTNQEIYWICPLFGATLAGFLFRSKTPTKNKRLESKPIVRPEQNNQGKYDYL